MDNAQVTQADRNAAAAVVGHGMYPGFPSDFYNARVSDTHPLVQAFARHRLERSVGWKGIDSAPKDGTDILVMYMHIDTQCVFNAFYASPDEGWEPEDEGWWSYEHSEVGRIKLEGWMTPTHWMPLPSAPGTTPSEPVAEIERLRGALRRLTDERTLQTTIPEGPWTPEMVAEFQSKEVGHMRDLARAALGDAS